MLKLKPRSRDKAVLFFVPDYHCSFFLRDELRRRGWRADIFVPHWYPRQFLYGNDVILERIAYETKLSLRNSLRMCLALIFRTVLIAKYRYVIHYGSFNYEVSDATFAQRCLLFTLSNWYRIVRLLGAKFVYIPTGCRQHVPKSQWLLVENGRVCDNCGFEPRCTDKANQVNFRLVRKFASAAIVSDGHRTNEFRETRIRYKSFDLRVFHPEIVIPPEFKWPPTSGVRILHSHALEDRLLNDKNIKGTPSVLRAIEVLQTEGHEVSLVNLSGIPSNQMRYHQVQADIVIDQLIYGGYGSTALECLALGKPVICYVRPSWKRLYESIYPEWANCPFISATPETLEEELRKLILDPGYRETVSMDSRKFAEQFLDVRKNAIEMEELLFALQ